MRTPLKLLVLLCLSLLLWNCEKQVRYNRIEGTLTPGLDISQTGLDSIPVVLAKIYDTIDFSKATFTPNDFDGYTSVLTDAGGYYHFDSLPDGNYVIACGNGFKFADVDFAKVSALKGAVYEVNKSVNRLPSSNGFELYVTQVKNESICKIFQIEFFIEGYSQATEIVVEPGNQHAQTSYFNFWLEESNNPSFELSVLRIDSVFKSPRVFFFKTNSTVDLTHYYGWYNNQRYTDYVMMTKGFWFGHFIQVYSREGKAILFN